MIQSPSSFFIVESGNQWESRNLSQQKHRGWKPPFASIITLRISGSFRGSPSRLEWIGLYFSG